MIVHAIELSVIIRLQMQHVYGLKNIVTFPSGRHFSESGTFIFCFDIFIVSINLNQPNLRIVKDRCFKTSHTKKEPKLLHRPANMVDFVQGVVNDTPWRISVNVHFTYKR